jgi:FlaA1/EpsC-like NDP-sugar epimerase
MMEANPVAAIQNNVFGSLNLLEAARSSGTSRLVFISTDKAVSPISVYGASKQLAEQIMLQQDPRCASMVVRFGNVLASRGSILPLFRRQIEKGGPVTITDTSATLFFMTIPEAVSLVLKAGGVGTPGELYALDMGEPVSIADLAQQLIRFYGHSDGDIPIQEIGLRPGEKLTEELIAPGEELSSTPFERIFRVQRKDESTGSLHELLSQLEPICFLTPENPTVYRNRRTLRQILTQAFPNLLQNPEEPEY